MKMKRKYSKKKEMGVRRSPRDLVKKKVKRMMKENNYEDEEKV